jgi:ankyrin repeat protein
MKNFIPYLERQSPLRMYNLTTPLLRNKLYAALLNKDVLKMAPPDLHTPQWHQLRDHPLVRGLVEQQYKTALIQKTYITAWDLLLQPTVLDNAPLASELMRVLAELLPYVKGAKVYAQKLFGTGLPKAIFIKLVNMDVERGVQLVCRHFARSDAHAFIAEVDTSLHTVVIQGRIRGGNYLKKYSSMISVLTGKPYPSFLHFALESFYLKNNHLPCKLTHPGLKDLLKAFLLEATDCPITYEELLDTLGEKYNPFEVSKLLDQQPHFNAHTPIKVTDNHTPLMLACRYNQPELIQCLLQQPAVNMNIRNIKRESALDYAVKYSTPDVVQALLAHGVEKDTHLFAFYYALKLKKNEMISALLPKVNQEEFINQALRHAITERNPYVVYTLIKDYAVDYNTQDDDGYSALFIALTHYNNVEVSRPLLNTLLQYPDLKIQGETEKNEALAYALRLQKYSDTELIELVTRLIKLGADCHAQDEYGYTPLMLTCTHKREGLINLLLQQPSIDINAKNKEGYSVLTFAVSNSTLTTVETLLKHGVNADTYLDAFNYALKKKSTI